MGTAPFSWAGRHGIKAVRPNGESATANGLSHFGDTATQEKLWRGEEELGEGMEEETDTQDRAPNAGVVDTNPRGDLEPRSADEEQEDEEAG